MKGQYNNSIYRKMKGKLAGILACIIFFTSVPQVPVYGFTDSESVESDYINDDNDDAEAAAKATDSDAPREENDTKPPKKATDSDGENLYKKGKQTYISLEVAVSKSSQGSEVAITASPSDAGVKKGVTEIQDIVLLSDKNADFDFEEPRSFEYQEFERQGDQATFFIEKGGSYYIGIGYETEEDSYRVVIPYNISNEDGISYFGVEDTEILAGEKFDLLEGVKAEDDAGVEIPVGVLQDGGFDPEVPGIYVVTYAPHASLKARSAVTEHTKERRIVVKATSADTLFISSNIHGAESGKTLSIVSKEKKNGILSVTYQLPKDKTNRYLKFSLPNFITVAAWPTDNYNPVKKEEGPLSTLYRLDIKDDFTGDILLLNLQYETEYVINSLDDYFNKIELGWIEVSSGYGTTDMEIQSIGPFTLDYLSDQPIEESHLMLQKGGVITKSSATHEAKLDDKGKFQFPSTPVAGGAEGDAFIFNIEHQLTKRPYRIKGLRVFAPEGFKFEKAAGYGSGITIQKDTSGLWYADILDVTSNQAASLKGLLVTLENKELSNGSYTSKASIVSYDVLSADGTKTEGTYETTPLLTISTDSGRIYETADLLWIRSDIIESDPEKQGKIYFDEIMKIHRTTIENQGKYIGDSSDGKKRYTQPNYDGAELRVKYIVPGENQISVKQIQLDPRLSSGLSQPGRIQIKEVIFETTDGKTVTYSPSELGLPSNGNLSEGCIIVLPPATDFLKTKSIEIIFDKFVEAELSVYWPLGIHQEIKDTIKPEGTPLASDAAIIYKKLGQMTASEIKFPLLTMYPKRIWQWSFGWTGTINRGYYDATMGGIGANWDTDMAGMGVTVNHIKATYKFIDNDDRSKLAGMAVVYKSCNVKITRISNLGNQKNAEAHMNPFDQIELDPWPSEDEYIKELILEIDSLEKTLGKRELVVNFVGTNKLTDLHPYLEKDSTSVFMHMKCSIESDQWPMETNAVSVQIGTVGLRGTAVIDDLAAETKNYTQSPNDIFEYTLPDYKFKVTLNGAIGNDPSRYDWMYPDTYVLLNDESNFAFQGVESPWKYEKIHLKEGNVLRLYRDGNAVVDASAFGNDASEFVGKLPQPKLTFQVLYGYAGDTAQHPLHPVKELWYDMSQVEGLKKSWLRYNDKNVKVPEDRFVSGAPLTSNLVLKYSGITQFKGVKLTTSGSTGAYLKAGVNGEFGATASGVTSDEYQAEVFVNTGNDAITSYSIVLDVPQNGLHLKGAATVKNHSGTNLKATYRLVGSGSDEFVEASKITDWKTAEVEQIRIIPETGTSLAANTQQTITLPLEADTKTMLGDQIVELKGYYFVNGAPVEIKATRFILKDYERSITAWWDQNENGKNDSEPSVSGLAWKLSAGGKDLVLDTDYTIASGTNPYVIKVTDVKDLKLTVDENSIESGYQLIPQEFPGPKTKTDSDFDKNTRTVSLDPKAPTQHVNLGFVQIGKVTVKDIVVKERKSSMAAPKFFGLPDTAPTSEYTYNYDVKKPKFATISPTGNVEGIEAGTTDVTLTATNKFGDEIKTDFEVVVTPNISPKVTATSWIIIEGDTINDLWTNVVCTDPKNLEPPSILKFEMPSSITEKSYTIWKGNSKAELISLEEASKAPGIYPVAYTVKDEDGNVETNESTTITVYGKLKAQFDPYNPGHFHAAAPEWSLPVVEFFYNDESGEEKKAESEIPKIESGMGGEKQVKITKAHPLIEHVTKNGVTAGTGRSSTFTAPVFVDSIVNFTIPPELETHVVIGKNSEIDLAKASQDILSKDVAAAYTHYASSGSAETNALLSVWEVKTTDGVSKETELTDNKINIQTPGIYTYKYKATANETYGIPGTTNPEVNQSTSPRTIHAITQPAITTAGGKDTIYVTSEQAKDETFVNDRIGAAASYVDETNASKKLSPIIKYEKNTDGIITKATITATVLYGGKDVIETKDVSVVVRNAPMITMAPIFFRVGEYTSLPDLVLDLERKIKLEPADNTSFLVDQNPPIDLQTAGEYTYLVAATDELSLAVNKEGKKIYIQGNPMITVKKDGADIHELAIETHQSTQEELIRQVKQYTNSEVTYTGPSIGSKDISLTDKVTYTVSGNYVPGVAGVYTVTLKVDDSSVTNQQTDFTSLTSAVTEKEIQIQVADHVYQVKFHSNDELNGTFEEGNEFTTGVVHGESLNQLPTPKAKEGYNFDGFQISEDVRSTLDVTLKDGTVIPKGTVILKGTVIPGDQAKQIIIDQEVSITAVFQKMEFTVNFIGRRKRVIKTEQVKYKESATAPTTQEMGNTDSIDFVGWSTGFGSITSNLDVYAVYRTTSGGGGGGAGDGTKPDNGNNKPSETLPSETLPSETLPGETQPSKTLPGNGTNTPGETAPDNGNAGDNTGGSGTGNDGTGNNGTGNNGTGNNGTGNDGTGNDELFDLDDGKIPLKNWEDFVGYVEEYTHMSRLPRLTDDTSLSGERWKKNGKKEVLIKKIGEQNGSTEKQGSGSGNTGSSMVLASGIPGNLLTWAKKCTLHFLLLGIALLEAIYLLIKRKKKQEEDEE